MTPVYPRAAEEHQRAAEPSGRAHSTSRVGQLSARVLLQARKHLKQKLRKMARERFKGQRNTPELWLLPEARTHRSTGGQVSLVIAASKGPEVGPGWG